MSRGARVSGRRNELVDVRDLVERIRPRPADDALGVDEEGAAAGDVGLWNGGRLPFDREIGADGVVTFREGMTEIVREAFELRASGRSVADVLAVLRDRTGLPLRSLNIAQRMLRDDSLIGVVDGVTFRRSRACSSSVAVSLRALNRPA
jgi:hypothetical protein